MEVVHIVHTCLDVRYWSELLFCTVLTHKVKVTDSEKINVKVFG